jgi:maltooligosyltrehalose trehalohydrolase
VLIAEDERNERGVVLPPEQGGLGFDAVWADDLHHQLRRLTAGDHEGYFGAYSGSIDDVVATLRRGWYYEGQHSAHGRGPRGTPAGDLPPRAFVHCLQNHDQVGNRAMGDRLTDAVPLPVYRALSALLLLSPYTPMLWMGQEWAASTPFRYFTDHSPELGQLVTTGRREEFKHFSTFSDAAVRERIPDPQAEETFRASKLCWAERERGLHRGVLALYRTLLSLRRSEAALAYIERDGFAVERVGDGALSLWRWVPGGEGPSLLVIVQLGGERMELTVDGTWDVVLDTEATEWADDGVPATTCHEAGRTSITRAGAGAVVLRR